MYPSGHQSTESLRKPESELTISTKTIQTLRTATFSQGATTPTGFGSKATLNKQ